MSAPPHRADRPMGGAAHPLLAPAKHNAPKRLPYRSTGRSWQPDRSGSIGERGRPIAAMPLGAQRPILGVGPPLTFAIASIAPHKDSSIKGGSEPCYERADNSKSRQSKILTTKPHQGASNAGNGSPQPKNPVTPKSYGPLDSAPEPLQSSRQRDINRLKVCGDRDIRLC